MVHLCIPTKFQSFAKKEKKEGRTWRCLPDAEASATKLQTWPPFSAVDVRGLLRAR
jgi:hypothetical protein